MLRLSALHCFRRLRDRPRPQHMHYDDLRNSNSEPISLKLAKSEGLNNAKRHF